MDKTNQILLNARLIWRLLRDRRVPWPAKFLPLLSVLYILFIADFVPDFLLGLGQVDDLTLFLLGMKLFLDFSPQSIVQEHRQALVSPPKPFVASKEKGGG